MAGTCHDHGGDEKYFWNVFQIYERQRPFGDSGIRCEGRSKTLLKEIVSEGVAWIKLV
jgi:hypothetical protein